MDTNEPRSPTLDEEEDEEQKTSTTWILMGTSGWGEIESAPPAKNLWQVVTSIPLVFRTIETKRPLTRMSNLGQHIQNIVLRV